MRVEEFIQEREDGCAYCSDGDRQADKPMCVHCECLMIAIREAHSVDNYASLNDREKTSLMRSGYENAAKRAGIQPKPMPFGAVQSIALD